MSDAKTQQEPSMEEILASIRRIISEDADGQKPAGAPEAAPAAAAGADDDILELTDRVNDDGSVESMPDGFPDLDGGAKPSFTGGDKDDISFDQDEFSHALMSGASSAAAASAFAQLEQEMSVPPRPGGGGAAPAFGGSGMTVEQLVREALKEWLDRNLPGMVEDLVRSEIERVAQAGRRR